MNQILRFPNPAPFPAAAVAMAAPPQIVRDMAMHLIAGMTEGLDITSDRDVIRYLMNTSDRYRAKVVAFHMDAAVYEAKQTVMTAVFGAK